MSSSETAFGPLHIIFSNWKMLHMNKARSHKVFSIDVIWVLAIPEQRVSV